MIVQRTSHVFPAGAAQRSSISRAAAPPTAVMGTPRSTLRQAEKVEPPPIDFTSPKVSTGVQEALGKISAR
jgi:hypothetical protein